MYLKQVHMENFKSFGTKLSVPFSRGFTAITGPNGSGKSNIGDAILFVLGPRSSKAIRAGKLSELIFNGGRDGKAAKECQVSLTFDNSDRLMPVDDDEVILTRRVRLAPKPDDPDNYYSYFYINGRAASMKEFSDLLDHARISADGYNIVTQGHVTEIVTMGAVKRRQVIEDIAGITEFDKDIEKAYAQKSEVETNLERIGIVLGEIERNIRQLKKDRDSALRWKELVEDLKKNKGQHALVLKHDLERRIANTHERVKKLEEDRRKAVEAVNILRDQEREKVRRLAEIEEEIAETGGEELREIQEQIKELRDKRSKAEQSLNHAKDEIEEIDTELGELRRDLKRIEKEHQGAHEEAKTHEEHAAAVKETAERLEKEVTAAKDSIAQTDSDAMSIQRKLAELKKDYESTSAKRHDKDLALDRMTERRDALERALDERRTEENAAKTDIDEIDVELEELKEVASGDTAKALEKQLFDKKKEQARLTEEAQDLEKAADRARRRLAELRAMKEATEGVERAYSRAVDAVLTARDKGSLKGVCGTIAELGQVDAKNGLAIETAAGPRTQCIVTETASDAQAAIEYLRKNNLGRATFLPLDKMTGTMPRGKALMVVKDPASLGFALDLITFNKRYEKAFQYVFGDTIVVQGLDDARRLMGGVRLVTQKGDLIEASGAMSGGSVKKGKDGAAAFGGVDTAELERVASELRAAETHLETLAGTITELRGEIHALEDRLREAKGSTEELLARTKKLEQARAEAAKKFETAKELVFKQSGELDTLDDEIGTTRDAVAAMNDRLAQLDAERERLSGLLLASTKKELADRIRQMDAELDAARNAYRDAEQKRSIASEKARLVHERVVEYEEKIARTQKEQDEHRADIDRHKTDIATLDKEIDTLEATTREASSAVAELQDEKDTVKDLLSDIRIKIDKKATEAETGYALIAKEKDALPALEEQLGEVLVELRETDYVLPDDETLPPLDVLKKNIREIEWSIGQLGPINQRALEEYEEQEKRRDELVAEVEHLNEERTALQQLVDEIVGKKKKEFMEVFDAINANFQTVFERLSEGGTAHLELENPEDPFQGGLIMKARPKGKRVLRIDALSGGEKSMTALAFIFAIQEYEPSPFYYLDEVDQNLDGVNSHTIGRTVKENSRTAQFIVVSLRKVTLKQADHIYGVTMQRVGVSEMVGNFDIDRIDESGNEVKGKGRKERPLPDDTAAAVVAEEVLPA